MAAEVGTAIGSPGARGWLARCLGDGGSHAGERLYVVPAASMGLRVLQCSYRSLRRHAMVCISGHVKISPLHQKPSEHEGSVTYHHIQFRLEARLIRRRGNSMAPACLALPGAEEMCPLFTR
jgi:hypothetical protein